MINNKLKLKLLKSLISIYKILKIFNSYITLSLVILLNLAIWILLTPGFINDLLFSIVFTKPVNNIKDNNLSLKKLQAEIEQLKSGSNKDQQTNNLVDKNIDSNRNITNGIFRKSMIPGLLGLCWCMLTTIITYGHKIPFIAKIINLLSLWYGRTTWWKLLVILRKVFIVINAIIGVLSVFWISGFSTDNLIAGFYGIGYTYMEMLTSFSKRLFNWFFELFDCKIVPKSPKPPVNYNPLWKWWGPKENTWVSGDDTFKKIMDLSRGLDYSNSNTKIDVDSTSSWSIPNWLWYAGISVLSAGVIYICYSIYTDTSLLHDLNPFKSDSKAKTIDSSGSITPTPAQIALHDLRNIRDITKGGTSGASYLDSFNNLFNGFIGINKAILESLNPFNWFTNKETVENFMKDQMRLEKANTALYPYTTVNPYDTLWHKIRLIIYGETSGEQSIRLLKEMKATDLYNKLAQLNNAATNTPAGTFSTNFLGIGTPAIGPGDTVLGQVQAANAGYLEQRLNSIPSTPSIAPVGVDALADIVRENNVWNDTIAPQTTPEPLLDSVD